MKDEKVEFPGQEPKKPVRIGSMQTINVETGEVVEERKNAFTMLPPPEGTCPECAVDHPHDQPHNQQSMYYQMQFSPGPPCETWPVADVERRDGPLPETWRTHLIAELTKHGLPVPDDLREESFHGE